MCKIPGYTSIAEFERLNGISEGTTKRQMQRGYCQWPRVLNDGRKSHYLYKYWRSVIDRCEIKGHTAYKNYGTRGIRMCHSWRHDYWIFVLDIESLGPKPTIDHTLDRINPNGNYELSNVRWADKTTQSTNQRQQKNNTSGITGVSYHTKDGVWRVQIKRYGRYVVRESFSSKSAAIEFLQSLKDVV